MPDFPQFEYSMNQVKKAGEALKGDLVWSDERHDELIEIFRIANNWRDTHAYPMARLRHEMLGKMRSKRLTGITVARLKRMSSIRRKLTRISSKLDQIQDLGGCRGILCSIADVNQLVSAFRDNGRHQLHNECDYITKPKRGGYRSHHLIYRFSGVGDAEALNGRRVELQIRTRLQHAWATSVEAIGLFRREDMKAGDGDNDWLRLFDLMSAEFARAEICPEPAELPPHYERVAEIKELNRKLNAISTLENLRHAVRFTDTYQQGVDAPKYYRIEYDNVSRIVRVKAHFRPIAGISENDDAEQRDTISGGDRINTVFVEADKVEDLKAAYPNYFGDVQLFSTNLKNITLGNDAKEYAMPPQETVPPPPHEPPDMSWFRRRKRWG